MPHFDGAVLHRVEPLQARHDFTGGEKLDLEFVVGGLCDSLAHDVGAAINCVQRLRPARGHAPFQSWRGLRNCRRDNRRRTSGPENRDLDKISTFHDPSHLKPYRQPVSRRRCQNEEGRDTKTKGCILEKMSRATASARCRQRLTTVNWPKRNLVPSAMMSVSGCRTEMANADRHFRF